MCIIAVKYKGVARPTDEQFKQMMKANPDGFGLAYYDKNENKIVVKKTMKEKKYLKWVQKIDEDTPAIFHMRIATHGSVQEKNCHPFLSDDGRWAFAHNGVLTIHNEGDMTDSETYFKRIAMPFLNGGYTPNDTEFLCMQNAIIGTSKFVYMDSEGTIYKFGNFIEENGLFFSNSSYMPYDWRMFMPTFNSSCASNECSDFDYQEIDDDEFYELVTQIYDELNFGTNDYIYYDAHSVAEWLQADIRFEQYDFDTLLDATSEALEWLQSEIDYANEYEQ